MLRGLNFHGKPINKPLFSVMSVKSMYKKANAGFVYLSAKPVFFSAQLGVYPPFCSLIAYGRSKIKTACFQLPKPALDYKP
jgi:hypothetical protein